jgi:hypothetical protein
MGYITRYGGFWGQVPVTSGRIYWVAAGDTYTVEGRTYSASDGHDGLSPERALRTIDYAVGLCSADVHDVIVLLPGAHTQATTVTLDIDGITITGMPGANPVAGSRTNSGAAVNRTSVTTSGSVHVFTVTGADVEICNLHLIPAAGYAAIAPSAAADRMYVHDCTFNMSTAANTATMGVDITFTTTASVLSDVVIRNCYCYVSDDQGPFVRASGTCNELLIEHCTTMLVGDTAWADAIEVTTASLGTIIRDCDFLVRASGTAISDVIDVAGATVDGSSTIMRCYFAVGSDALVNGNVADNQCAENYLLQAAASVGGTLVLST